MRGIPQKRDILVLLLLCLYTSSVSGSWGPISECHDKQGCLCQEEKCVDNEIFLKCPRTCLNCHPCRDMLPSCNTPEGVRRCGQPHVRKECRKLCGYCTDQCIDQIDCYRCQELVKKHSCHRSLYLRKNCRFTCKLCTLDCEDIYSPETCRRVRANGMMCKSYAQVFCRKTCGACGDECSDEQEDCYFQGCPRRNYHEKCQKTCGVCGCSDKRDDCKQHITHCFQESWRRQCRKSCLICACRDNRRDCSQLRHRCHESHVRGQCPLTCGDCKNVCKDDIEPIYCHEFKKNYGCYGPYMRKYCKYTCEICRPKCEDYLPGYICHKYKGWKKCHFAYVKQFCQKTCNNCPTHGSFEYYQY